MTLLQRFNEHVSLATRWLERCGRQVTDRNIVSIMSRMDAATLREALDPPPILTRDDRLLLNDCGIKAE